MQLQMSGIEPTRQTDAGVNPMAANSIRERILQALVARLNPVATDQAASVWRTPSVAITRDQCPALVVFPESESLAERANDRITRELTVRFTQQPYHSKTGLKKLRS